MKTFFLLLFIFISILTFSQNDKNNANIWYFGNYAGVDFNQVTPVALTNSAMNTAEGSAVVCNKFGELLFYTDGSDVWDRNHNLMPNGTGLMGSNSASQSSIIVPQYSDTNKYYIFTVDAVENSLSNGFRYSVVDMTWNGGLGDITSDKNILLFNPACEKICAVYSSSYPDMWIIAHEYGTNSFYSYLLNGNGLQPPVISNIGTIHQDANKFSAIGHLKSSSLGNKIAVGIRGLNKYEIFDFNNLTGVISNPITTGYFHWAYGLDFSPDGNKLFLIKRDSKEFVYLDLTAGTPTDVLNSETLIGSSAATYVGALQMGPDGNIYVSKRYENYLGIIKDADTPNPYYIDNGLYLGGQTSEWGLPNIFYYKGWGPTNTNSKITAKENKVVYAYYNNLYKSIEFEIDVNQKESINIEILTLQGSQVKAINNKNLTKGKNYLSIPIYQSSNEVLLYKMTFSDRIVCNKVLIMKK